MIRLIDNNGKSRSAIENFIKDLFEQDNISFTTSGTTGPPKCINHTIDIITKYVKQSSENDVWGLTYDYTKIAGSQVIAQAYKNNNLLVNLYKKSTNEIHSLINTYNISHLSGTPTFYRLNFKNEIFPSVKQVTLGGETVTENIISLVKQVFPNANISNIYALTEYGSILSSSSHLFSLNNRTSKYIKIKNNTLHIYFNKTWNDTGDQVKILDDGSFAIIGRSSSMINVGGFKANPYYIEDQLNSILGVIASKVYSKPNSVTGNIVVADVVLDPNTNLKQIKKEIRQLVQPYEVPRIINSVSTIKINNTGKIDRNNE